MSRPLGSGAGSIVDRLGLDILRISPRDERVRVTRNTLYPWRAVCSLLITARDGTRTTGTGWLVSPRVVVTAGQCVYLHDAGGWAASVEVVPGRDGAARPFGSAFAVAVRSVTGWVGTRDFDFDCGAVLLPADARLGERLGTFGFIARDDAALQLATLHMAGYPAEGGFGDRAEQGSQWYGSGKVREIAARRIGYDISTSTRQPGCPVWETLPDGGRYVVAIHSWGTRVSNGGTRITGEVADQIGAWVREAA